jgi:prepilin-type N-terminal cleavage/methylation domain-containing protein
VKRGGFTLVEMVVVMAIMVVVIGTVAPSLKGFLQGRNLTNEARQFWSLTHYGLNRAVNEGVPVDLWIDVKRGSYGLAASGGYTETKTNAVSMTLDPDVKMAVSPAPGMLSQSNFWTPSTLARGRRGVPVIRFQPDGFISDTSPQSVVFGQGTYPQIWIVENTNHTRYDIEFNHTKLARF